MSRLPAFALCALVPLFVSCSSEPSSGRGGPDRPDGGRPGADASPAPDDDVSSTDEDALAPDVDDVSVVPDEDAVDLCTEARTFCQGNQVIACTPGVAPQVQRNCTGGCRDGACVVNACADEKGYYGCSFVAVDLNNSMISMIGSPARPNERWGLVVSNPNDHPVVVTLRDAAGTVLDGPRPLPAGDLHLFEPPPARTEGTHRGPHGVFVEADAPVLAHQFNPIDRETMYSNDASLLFPVSLLGTEYIALAWPTEVPLVTLPGARNVLNGFVTIAAPAPSRVTVQLPPGVSTAAGGSVPAIPAGGTETFDLAAGEVLTLTPPQTNRMDLTGMVITSTTPVAVFGGAECAYVPMNTSYCDHLEQQLLPTNRWGQAYAIAKTRARDREPDLYRIVASQDGTIVSTTPNQFGSATTIRLDRGQHHEFVSAGDFALEANAPVMVGQYMVSADYPTDPRGRCDRDDGGAGCAIRPNPACNQGGTPQGWGDPAFLIAIPAERWLDNYVVLTPQDYLEDWLTLVSPADASLSFDGTPITEPSTPVAGTPYVVRRIRSSPGAHRVSGDAPFALQAYGFECHVSYAYAGGAELGE